MLYGWVEIVDPNAILPSTFDPNIFVSAQTNKFQHKNRVVRIDTPEHHQSEGKKYQNKNNLVYNFGVTAQNFGRIFNGENEK